MATYIRDEILKRNRLFDDITSVYRRLATYMYQGYVPNIALDSDNVPELKAIGSYHDVEVYDHKGKPVGTRKIDTLNFPRVATSLLRNLILGEGDELSIDNDENEEKIKWFTDILEYNRFYQNESDLVEMLLNTGDILNTFALRKGKIKISYLNGFRFEVVEWEQGVPKSIVLYTDRKRFDKKDKAIYYTLLEWHKLNDDDEENPFYEIRREVYEGYERYQLERGVNFRDHIGLFGALTEKEQFFGIEEPMFTFTRLPIKNNKQLDTIRGIGLMINSFDAIRNLDLTYDANNREIEMTQTQVLVPDEMLEHGYDREGNLINHYNKKTRWYSGLNASDGFQFNPVVFNPTIRQEQYSAKLRQDLEIIGMQIGTSPGTFSFESGRGIMTATQVVVENDRTHRTRTEFGNVVSDGWKDLIWRIYKYAKFWNLITWDMEYEDIDWKLKDSVVLDDQTIFERDMTAVQNELMPKKEFLMRHYNLSDTQADEWIEQLDSFDFGEPLEINEEIEEEDEEIET